MIVVSPIVPAVAVTLFNVELTFALVPSRVNVRVPDPEMVAAPVVANVVPTGAVKVATMVSLVLNVDAPMCAVPSPRFDAVDTVAVRDAEAVKFTLCTRREDFGSNSTSAPFIVANGL